MTASKLRRTAATEARQTKAPDLLALLDGIGGLVYEQELHRQFERRGWDREEAMLRLYELQAAGDIDVYFTLSRAAKDRVRV